MDHLALLAPALFLLATFVVGLAVYCGLRRFGRAPEPGEVKHNLVFGRFLAEYLAWLLGPVEPLLVGRVSPNLITLLSLAMCAAMMGYIKDSIWPVLVRCDEFGPRSNRSLAGDTSGVPASAAERRARRNPYFACLHCGRIGLQAEKTGRV